MPNTVANYDQAVAFLSETMNEIYKLNDKSVELGLVDECSEAIEYITHKFIGMMQLAAQIFDIDRSAIEHDVLDACLASYVN